MADTEYDNIGPGEYGDYIQSIAAALAEASGSDDEYRTRALEAQMKSAQAARENAMKIAQLQASTSRYGIDTQARTEMAKLKENARQFDAQHGLAIAEAYTKFASTPDLMFARNDFVDAMGRVGQGLSPQAAITRSPGPQAKTYQDFAALAQYNGSTVPGASSSSGGGSGSGSAGASSAASGGSNGAQAEPPDPRIKAATGIVQALPPSEGSGHSDNDWAAINAIRSLYESGRPGFEARLGPERTKIALAGLARAGFDPNLVTEEYRRSLPGQKSPVLAA